MKHDFRADPSSTQAEAFLEWLESETTSALRRDRGDAEATKSSVFLYVNRAYEAGLPDHLIGGMFGRCVVGAGFNEAEQEPAFDLLEALAEIAKKVHSPE